MVAAGWWALVAVTLQLDQGTLIVAVTSALSPSFAVLLAYRLTRRTETRLADKLEAQNAESALRDQAAREAIREQEQVNREAVRVAAEAKATADLTHGLVNSQKDQLEADKARLEDEKTALVARVAALEAR